MKNTMQSLRGMKDLLPLEFNIHEFIIQKAKAIGMLYGFEQMSTPILEFTEVFDRTLGSSSDVVSKEMYNFLDKGGRSVALRPEFTAGIMRACISNKLFHKLPMKFFSSGPVFRYDNPQAGRYRQFHQINFEHIGADGAATDAEVIKIGYDILKALQIEGFKLEINSLGCSESRDAYQAKLIEYFQQYYEELSEDSKKRLLKNPLRILDSKNEIDKKIASSAPLMLDYYTKDSKAYFDNVLRHLDSLQVEYVINPKIVRGLDYYSHTAFEFTTENLGAQSTLLAGGRYDGLARIMGGPDTLAVGFAAGIERLALLFRQNLENSRPIFIMPIGEENIGYCLQIADRLRQQNIPVELDCKGKVQKRMARALEKSASHIIFIGDEERIANLCKLKDLDKSEEYECDMNSLVDKLKNRLVSVDSRD